MPIYTIYMRSFAPWREFGDLVSARYVSLPAVVYRPPSPSNPGFDIVGVPTKYGGSFHGDGRGFSLETDNPAVTARVNAVLDVQVPQGLAVKKRTWCDESRGPKQAVGFESSAVGVPTTTFIVSKHSDTVEAVINYGAANPLIKGAPDIDAEGEFKLTQAPKRLTIVCTVTGDQFPACEAFIVDPRGTKLFLGGFAPGSKTQYKLLYGSMNKPKEVWFESELVVTTDADGNFLMVNGGGSGSNSSGPACEGLTMLPTEWNLRIMGSILMPSDAP